MRVEEPAREAFLYRLWIDEDFSIFNLRAIDGRPLEIKEKGQRNYDAGPDFLNALIVIDGEMKRGDVEIHSLAGDWIIHGHNDDPRYNNVVLHVVTMDCPRTFKTVRQDGQIIPTLNLDTYLIKPAEQLEVEFEQRKIDAETEKCFLSQESDSFILQLVERAGDARLQQKADRFLERRELNSWDQLFYESIFVALGYSKNQVPFAHLSRLLPVETIWKYVWNDPHRMALSKCEAYLFGTAGLLPTTVSNDVFAGTSEKEYILQLQQLWLHFPERKKMNTLRPEAWKFFRLRPHNFPTRRLAAAAALTLRFMDEGFVGSALRVLSENDKTAREIRELENLYTVDAHGFWADHYSFDDSLLDRSQAVHENRRIVGSDRARDIVVNVTLPGLLAYAVEIDDGRLKNMVREIYARYPLLSENEITKGMRKKLFGFESGGKGVVTSVRHQQGMIHLQKLYCHPQMCNVCLMEDEL